MTNDSPAIVFHERPAGHATSTDGPPAGIGLNLAVARIRREAASIFNTPQTASYMLRAKARADLEAKGAARNTKAMIEVALVDGILALLWIDYEDRYSNAAWAMLEAPLAELIRAEL